MLEIRTCRDGNGKIINLTILECKSSLIKELSFNFPYNKSNHIGM